MQTAEGFAPVFFDPRPLTNLLLIDELDSLSPVLDMQVFCCLVASLASSRRSLYTALKVKAILRLASTAATVLSTLKQTQQHAVYF